MPVLPLVDLLILLGSGSAAVGALLKIVAVTTRYRPTFLSLAPIDLLLVSLLFFTLALVLAARTWLKLNEPHLMALQRRLGEEEARRRAQEIEDHNRALAQPPAAREAPEVERAASR